MYVKLPDRSKNFSVLNRKAGINRIQWIKKARIIAFSTISSLVRVAIKNEIPKVKIERNMRKPFCFMLQFYVICKEEKNLYYQFCFPLIKFTINI